MSTVFRHVKYKQFQPGDFEVSSKVVFPLKRSVKRDRKGEDEVHTIHSAAVSVCRAHKSLFEILRSNDWKYFITLTFASDKRSDDEFCRLSFEEWRHEVRRKFPSMYYVAVPEYHEKGSIHYHVVVGGVSGDDLGFIDSGRVLHFGKAWRREDFYARGFKVDLDKGEGATIYNVGAWSNGFSTATEIRCSAAVALYVSKYLTKSNLDPRFFNKRRYYTSTNVKRPDVVKDVLPTSLFDRDSMLEFADLSFNNPKFLYSVYDCPEDVIRARLRGDIPMPRHDLPFDTQ